LPAKPVTLAFHAKYLSIVHGVGMNAKAVKPASPPTPKRTVTTMTQQNLNQQTQQKNQVPASNQAQQPHFTQKPVTEANVKEIVIETLIQLDLIPRAQKIKAIKIE
jgi:hypothetical protein